MIETLTTEQQDFSSFLALLARLDTHIQENEDNAKELLSNGYTFRLCDQTASRASGVFDSMQKISVDFL